MIPRDVAADLPHLQESYKEMTGKSFRHFFCPFLHADEPTELCMGHVIPESYANCRRTKVTQRKDVDNFYGRVAEADYGMHLEVRGKTLPDLIIDQNLRKKVRPRFVLEGETVEYYADRGSSHPDHTPVVLENAENGRTTELVFKMRPDQMQSSLTQPWGIVVERDCRLTAMVTMVKAAYLTLFQLHGYQWALSHGGVEIGYSLLGRYFRENQGKDASGAREAMKSLFLPYKHIFRPIGNFGGGELPRGTLEDDFSGVCIGSSGKPFAQVVYVRIADQCHAVLMPAAENPDSAFTYFEFLKNDNEQLKVSHTRFNHEKQCWEMHPKPVTAHWPKKHATFDFD